MVGPSTTVTVRVGIALGSTSAPAGRSTLMAERVCSTPTLVLSNVRGSHVTSHTSLRLSPKTAVTFDGSLVVSSSMVIPLTTVSVFGVTV